ncbi:uncharacterized protein LOC126737565 [Anthonomus grandis grandis]|uniref:uncharacterized protein LOC126737565 n=1 Tax=Anthonomus grandis grandis TaxID=2921223 RepID=UPI0021666B5E|nr:uncharacterized protein LOC126737565 [Anthonomus grandis grandis]
MTHKTMMSTLISYVISNEHISMLIFLSLVAILTFLVWYYFIRPMSHFSKMGIPQSNPWPFLGDQWRMFFLKISFFDFINWAYEQFPKSRYSGFYQFNTPALLIRDPELIKQITIKDFDSFTDHRSFADPEADPLWGGNIFSLKGQRWREMRATLSGSFTSSKMKNMFHLMNETAEVFVYFFLTKNQNYLELEMKDYFTRYTNDVIASAAFGIEVNSLKNPDNIFYHMGRKLTNLTDIISRIKFFGYMVFPKVFKLFKIGLFSNDVSKFFSNIVTQAIIFKEKEDIKRFDMLSVLLDARKGIQTDVANVGETGFATVKEYNTGKFKQFKALTNQDIISQLVLFFFGGFDTISTVMCFGSYELALHKDIQDKLRAEINDVFNQNNGKLSYDVVLQMKYLDMVVCEILRKWSPANGIDRVVTKPYTIQPVNENERPVHLKAGDVCILPIGAIHRDPAYYQDPLKFIPERFSDQNKANIIPYTYLPFGSGPRNCIGSRFALLEVKALLFHLLYHFEIVPTSKTPIPLILDHRSFNLTAKGGFWFGLKKIVIRENFIMIWFILTVTTVILFWYCFVRPMSHFTRLGVKQSNPVPFFGDQWKFFLKKTSFCEFSEWVYNMFPNERYSGFYQFTVPTLVLRDPDLIKQIAVKDFEHFTDHRTFIDPEADPLWAHNLFALRGQRWREMRATLSGSFTSSKMKNMFYLMDEAAKKFVQNFVNSEKGLVEVEFKDAYTRYTNDVIATTAFGIQVDSLADAKNEFYLMGKELTNLGTFTQRMKFFGFFIIPQFFKIMKIGLFSKKAGNFFSNVIKENIKVREEKGIVRQDMLNLLLEARKGIKNEEKDVYEIGYAAVEESLDISKFKQIKGLTDDEITSQALIFFFAGFDTISTALSFGTYELAFNSEVQENLREEILETHKDNNGKLTYDILQKMKYLDMVVSEILRKWPAAVAVDRSCTKPYTIQPQRPGEKPISLKVGDIIWIPMQGIHRDPKNYEDPEKFDPERFSDENKGKIKPYTYLPFGVGPRNCIGSRFALLETKVLLYHLLRQFEVVPVTKSVYPLKLSRSLQHGSENGFWLGLKKLED